MNERIQNPITSRKPGLAFLAMVAVSAGFALPAFSQTLENAVDHPAGLTFSTVTYDYATQLPLPGIEWFPQTVTTHDTVDAAEASGLPKGSWSRLDATIQGPATVSWWWKAQTGNPFERVGFISDDHYLLADGDDEWQFLEVQIGCGEQVLSWFVDIDSLSTGVDGANGGWVDQIVVTPQPDVPAIQTGLDNATVNFYSDDWIDTAQASAPGAMNGTVAQSGPVQEGFASRMLFDVDGPVEISFDWGTESDPSALNSSLRFEVDGEVPDGGQIYESTTLTPRSFKYGPGHHCMSFIYFRDFAYVPDPENPDPPYQGGSEGYIDNLVITQIPSSPVLADAVDVAPDVYGKAWYRQDLVSHDGTDSACVSGLNVGDSETLYYELPDDAGLLSLWVKLSTEAFGGYLDVKIDGNYIQSFTGEQDWIEVEANLGPGNGRVLTITYVRENAGAGDIGTNTAYVDQIVLTPGASNFRPDLTIKAPGGKYKGANRYNGSGANQTAKYKAKLRRPFAKFKMRCQNDCPTDSDTMKFYGTKSNKNFEIFYIVKFEGKLYNISAEFQTGKFSTQTLEFLQSEPYEVWISRIQGSRRRTQTARVRGVSESDASKVDTVKAKMIVDRFLRR